ncbi:MAG TPA: xanthine dehydrogenase family protein molybdopterin-binding subunit [Chloroflexota bacterium]
MGDTPPPPTEEIGRARLRVEDRRLLTGRGRYVDDLALPGTLDVAFVRSPHAHARIKAIDASAALGAPGVLAVLTAADVPPLTRYPLIPLAPDARIPPFEPLAAGVARAVGAPVAAVVAEGRGAAPDAAALVDVAYEPLPAVADAEAALAEGAPLVYPEYGANRCYRLTCGSGDVGAAFAQAAHTASLSVRIPRVAPAPLEPRGVLAQYDAAADELTVWATTQTPHRTREWLATALGLPDHRVRVVVKDMGGGFGARSSIYPEYVVAAQAARLLRRPVRWIASRSEDVSTTAHARDEVIELEAAADRHGNLLGLRARILGNLGCCLYATTQLSPWRIAMVLPGCYKVPAYAAEVVTAFTNTTPTAVYRGAGRPEAADCLERLLDRLAATLGIDPVALRARNLIPADAFPYTTASGVVYDSGNYLGALNLLLQTAHLRDLRERQREERARGERTLMGLGLATFVDPSAAGWESAEVRVEPSGRVTAVTGSTDHGQGHETTWAQILADRLGVPFDHARIRQGDTAVGPPGEGTFAARSTVLGGTSLVQAADAVIDKARRLAAGLLEAAPGDVRLEAGQFRVAGQPERAVGWAQVAAVAYGRGRLPPGETLGLEASGYFLAPRDTYAFGAALAVVRIDPDTGQVRVERLVAVDDCGTVVNPLLVEGQIWGGTAQGLGQALSEQVVYEPDGTLLTGSLMHYALPRASDMPPLTIVEQYTPSPLNPLGVKGVGEAGTIIGTAPIMNAVVDALTPLGITHLDMPYTAERVWAAIQQAGKG